MSPHTVQTVLKILIACGWVCVIVLGLRVIHECHAIERDLKDFLKRKR